MISSSRAVISSAEVIVAFIAHARDVPTRERQRFGDQLRAEPAGHGVLLETCHRVELYTTVGSADPPRTSGPELPVGGRVLRGEAAVRHAVAVAAGRDSVVVGEDQVLHQMRRALGVARSSGSVDPALDRLFASALRAGRRARSWQGGPRRSLADVAVRHIEAERGSLSGRDVLIVGAGHMGGLAARAAVGAGASLAVANRSPERASDLAIATGGRIEELDPGDRVAGYAGVIVALGGPWRIGPAAIDGLRRSPTIVVDLSVPPALPPHLAALLGPRLTTVDDLAGDHCPDDAASDRTRSRLDGLVDATTAEFLAWLDGRDRRAAARALVERADLEREAELAELWRRLPELDAGARATIEGMSRHLAERILREPLERLGSDADGRHERAVRELWAL